jgi:hypothetical protein
MGNNYFKREDEDDDKDDNEDEIEDKEEDKEKEKEEGQLFICEYKGDLN